MVSRSAVALAVLQEVVRIRPPIKVLYRLTTKDLAIGDIAVPKDTLIVLCPNKVRGFMV